MTDHGLHESFTARVIVCTCGDTLIARGSQDTAQFLAAHAESDPKKIATKEHQEDMKHIRLFKRKA